MAIGLFILFFSPVLLLCVPEMVANSVHYTEKLWYVFTPGVNFAVYAIGFLFLFLAMMILFLLDIKRISIIISIIFVLSGMGSFYVASQSYKSLSDHSISFSPLFSFKDYTYSWKEIKSVYSIDYTSEGYSEFKFVFTDGNSMSLRYNKYLWAQRPRIDQKLDEMHVAIKFVVKS
jgi:hypothetical protein